MKLLEISPQKDYLLVPDRVWDGISGKPVSGHAIYISAGVIRRLLPAAALCDFCGEGPGMVRLEGITLMPGLVDCHVHFSMNSENLFAAIDDWENRPGVVEQRARQAALDYLANGVIAVRDGGDKMSIGLKVKNDTDRGEFPGPLITAAGRAIYRKGKYGSFLGPGVVTVNDALEQVERFKADGIDQLKVVVSGLVSFKEFGVVGPPQFTVDELKPIVDKAHSLGLKVMAHASSAEAVEIAVKALVDSVEHGYFLETKQLELMAEYKTAWIPTMAPLGNLVSRNIIPYEGADLDVIRRSYEVQLSRIKEAYEMGVRLGVGTDAGANRVPHGYSYHDELGFYALAGLSNSAVLRLATSVSAEIVGRGHEIGSITAGKKPLLIGVSGDPLQSLDILREPKMTVILEPPAG